jgi:hypothetical protein
VGTDGDWAALPHWGQKASSLPTRAPHCVQKPAILIFPHARQPHWRRVSPKKPEKSLFRATGSPFRQMAGL